MTEAKGSNDTYSAAHQGRTNISTGVHPTHPPNVVIAKCQTPGNDRHVSHWCGSGAAVWALVCVMCDTTSFFPPLQQADSSSSHLSGNLAPHPMTWQLALIISRSRA